MLPACECSYVIGNPPFLGASNCNPTQKQEIVDLYGKIKLSNSLDYVAGWYYKACEYIKETSIRCAFVSTNSITQGEQVYPIWRTLRKRFDVKIDFAWTTFVWDSEASEKAHVHVVIIGFSNAEISDAFRGQLFHSDGETEQAECISPYLMNLPFIVPISRKKPLCDVAPLSYGNKPTDDGAFVFTDEEKVAFIASEPAAEKFFRRYVGAKDYLNGTTRWCLWLLDVPIADYMSLPLVQDRVEHVRQFRLASSAKDTRKRAESPNEFFRTPVHDTSYLAIPRTSSERRRYLPIGFFDETTIPSDATSVIANAGLYEFGILSSIIHNAWTRTVAGRLKSDYRYSGDVVYNNFMWPKPTSEQKQKIEQLAQSILDIRDAYPDKSLADLYDPDKMPNGLLQAHKALDKAVEEVYGVDFGGDEEKIVAHLFKLYAEATEGE